MKHCSRCAETKPLDQFSGSWCKPCRATYAKAWRAERRGRIFYGYILERYMDEDEYAAFRDRYDAAKDTRGAKVDASYVESTYASLRAKLGR